MLRFEGIGAERDLAGMPVARIPGKFLDPAAPAGDAQVAGDYRDMVTMVRRNRQSGLVVPSDPWPESPGMRQYDVELMRAGGERQFDTDKLIARYNREMALALLADWLLLGHEKVGSFALASSKTHMFSVAIGAWLDSIAAVFNRHAIPRLLKLNPALSTVNGYPRLTPGDTEVVDFGEFAQAWSTLTAGGFIFTEADEEWFRRRVGLPARVEAET